MNENEIIERLVRLEEGLEYLRKDFQTFISSQNNKNDKKDNKRWDLWKIIIAILCSNTATLMISSFLVGKI